MIPVLNNFAGVVRIFWAVAYGAKVLGVSFTTRPYKHGITDTFKKFWTEEVPYIVKQGARGFVVAYLSVPKVNEGLGLTYWTTLVVAGYDLATNNVEALKNSKYVPNYWA